MHDFEPMKISRLLAATGVCAAVLLAAFLWPVGTGPAAGSDSLAERPAPTETEAPAGEDPETLARVQAETANAELTDPCILHVLDPDGQPLESATLLAAPAGQRRLRRFTSLGESDPAGTIRFDNSRVEPTQTCFVHAEGFQPATVDPGATDQTVYLQKGHNVPMTVVDRLGNPIHGATVLAARIEGGPIPPETAVDNPAPGFPPDYAIYSAVTGPNGVAQLRALTAGQYFVDVRHPSMVACDLEGTTQPGLRGFTVPGSNWKATLASVRVAVARFENDEVVSYSYRLDGSVDMRHPAQKCESIRRILQEHADDFTVAWTPSAEAERTGATLQVTPTFLLARAGSQTVTIDLTSIEDFQVRTVKITPPAEQPVCTPARVVIDPPLPDCPGHPLPWFTISGSYDENRFSVNRRIGERFALPPGTYRLGECSPFLRAACTFPESIDVHTPSMGEQTIILRRTKELVPAEVWFATPDGANSGTFTDVSLVHESGTFLFWGLWTSIDGAGTPGLDPRVWVLPGVYDFWAKRQPVGKVQRSIIVPQSSTAVRLELTW